MTKFNYHFNQLSLFIGLSLFVIASDTLEAANTVFLSNSIQFTNSLYKTYGQGNEGMTLKSEKGYINLDNQDIHLIGNVEAKFKLDGLNYSINSDSLISDLLGKSIYSKEKTLFAYKNLRNVKRSDPKDCKLIWNETYKYSFYKKRISVGTLWFCD